MAKSNVWKKGGYLGSEVTVSESLRETLLASLLMASRLPSFHIHPSTTVLRNGVAHSGLDH